MTDEDDLYLFEEDDHDSLVLHMPMVKGALYSACGMSFDLSDMYLADEFVGTESICVECRPTYDEAVTTNSEGWNIPPELAVKL